MTISFVCPQGHPLTAQDSQAGQAGKCPHCGTRFLIPQLAGDEDDSPTNSTTSAVSSSPKSSSPRVDSIVFTCPNGHKLNGPASLRGKLGLCPHCQTKFRIPAIESPAAGSGKSVERPLAASAPLAAPSANASLPDVDDTPLAEILDEEDLEVVEGRPLDESSEAADTFQPWREAPPVATDTSRWCELFGWLWSQRDARSTVDLRLRSGEVFRPAWYAPSMSDSQIGVFGVAAENSSYGITVVRWELVERIDVRGCDQLPAERFE